MNLQKKMHSNWMKNKNFQILEIGTFQPLSVKLILETIKYRGHLLTYYKKHIKIGCKIKNSIYHSNMKFFRIWPILDPLFEIK